MTLSARSRLLARALAAGRPATFTRTSAMRKTVIRAASSSSTSPMSSHNSFWKTAATTTNNTSIPNMAANTNRRWLSSEASSEEDDVLASPREAMAFDVLIVGGGPAGLAAAIRFKQLCAEQDKDLSVCVIDKGR